MITDAAVVILAGGQGTRMKSRMAKVLHRAGGKALVEHAIDTARQVAPPDRVFVVVGHQADAVRALWQNCPEWSAPPAPRPVLADTARAEPTWAQTNLVPVRAEPTPVRAEPTPVRAEPVEAQAGPSTSSGQALRQAQGERFEGEHAISIQSEVPDAAHAEPASAQTVQVGADVTRISAADLPQLMRHGWRDLLASVGRASASEAGAGRALALQALQALSRFQLLCALRDGPQGVQALNALAAHQLGLPTQGWYAGRPVMVTHNDYDLGLMNGDVGLCLPNQGVLRVAFGNGAGGVRWVLPSRLDAVETVFAMTVHKSQGSEFEHVTLVLPAQGAPVLTRELLYTGITRARLRLSLWCPSAAVLDATVQRKVLRSGGLAQGLRQEPGLT